MDNLTLQSFCIANNIKYLTYNSFYHFKDEHVSTWNQDLKELIDSMQEVYYHIDSPITKERSTTSFDWKKSWDLIKTPNFYRKDEPISTFNQFIKANLKDPYIGLHPSPEGHKIWAKELANYLKEHII